MDTPNRQFSICWHRAIPMTSFSANLMKDNCRSAVLSNPISPLHTIFGVPRLSLRDVVADDCHQLPIFLPWHGDVPIVRFPDDQTSLVPV